MHSPAMSGRLPVGVFFGLFTISGFAGLIYQSIWSHYLKLFLGHAAYAQTLVLAIFMGGMALGSWAVSRYTHRIGDLLRGYAIAELGIGMLAFLFHRVFVFSTGWAFDTVLPSLGGFGVDLFKWTLASLLILPASVLLGTTFPLMSAGIMRAYPDVGGRTLAMLYFTNSFGAAFGVLASGFYLIGRLGLPGTLLAAGAMNVALALLVWLLVRSMPASGRSVARTDAVAPAAGRIEIAVLLIAFFTGTASFIYEITWIRMLTLGLGASTHAFEVMLAAFILAMAIGAYWFRNRITRLGNDLGWLAGILALKAAFAAFAIWIYGDVLALIRWTMLATARNDDGYVLTTVAGFVASSIVMFPSAFCAGISLPLATQVLTGRGSGERSIGRVYAANTAGCILGAAFATHVGMELFGVKGLTGTGALLDAIAAIAALAVAGRRIGRLRVATATAAAALGLGAFLTVQLDLHRMSSGVYRHGVFLTPAMASLRFYRDGKTATVAVLDLDTMRSIRTNGKSDAAIEMAAGKRAAPDEYTMTMAAALTLALKPEAARVANIGFGSGLTTHVLLGSTRLQELDNIEIERTMVEAARLFLPRNARAYDDPRSRIHIEDAKTFFSARGKPYDVIISEPSGLWVSGIATLFSEEFYAHAHRHLREDGLLVQWIQAYEVNVDIVSSVFKALGRHFSDYTVYSTGPDLLVVATPSGRVPQLKAELFGYAGVASELAHLGIASIADLDAMRVGSRASLEPLFESFPMRPNSDFFPVVDQNAPRSRYKNETATGLSNLRDSPSGALPLLDRDVRAPLERISRAGLNRPLWMDRMLIGAEAVGVALTGRASEARALEGAPLKSAVLVHALASGCDGAQVQWVNALSDVMDVAGPHLRADDLVPLFAAARKSACWRALDQGARLRVDLLEAVAVRDGVRIGELAVRVLDERVRYRTGERSEQLSAAMAAALAVGSVDKAQALHDRHWGTLTADEQRALPMLLVEAHLQDRQRRR
jgi:spermidine synthase